jgi:ABC-type antimicrobial peptide transport system permease subunit
MISAIRAQIASVDPDQPVINAQPVDALMNSSRTQPRFIMVLLATFSGTALVLALTGIYGVLAYSVAQRRQELSIRVALGANRSDILRLVVHQGLVLAASGIVIGTLAALVVTRLTSSMLYKVSSLDLLSFGLAPLLFLAVALLTSYVPARRATEVDPMSALRQG